MVSIEEARRTILGHITTLETEKVPLFEALNRVTPDDHVALKDIPAAERIDRRSEQKRAVEPAGISDDDAFKPL